MAVVNETAQALAPRELVVSRTFKAPRERVFRAWSSAEHLKHWFCPAGFAVPQAQVEFHPGGRFDICMRSPDGQDFWNRGRFVEIEPASRLVIEIEAVVNGQTMFGARTAVTFTETCEGTRMEVTQTYTPVPEELLQNALAGWAQTLDRLEREVARMQDEVAARSVVHGSFRLERGYPAAPSRVFRALTDVDAKARWFVGGEGYTLIERTMDPRPGGRERLKGRWESGRVSTFDAVYFDVVQDQRVVFAYEMHLDERKISVSLATFELRAEGSGTRLVLTENGAFLDGYDDAGSREHGTNMLLDALGRSLQE